MLENHKNLGKFISLALHLRNSALSSPLSTLHRFLTILKRISI
jgi:hypothetical protein